MSLPSGLNYELVKTISTIFCPGAVFSIPYIWAIAIKWPSLGPAAKDHPGLAAIFLGLIFVGCGMLMEDLGARIEEGLDKWNKGSTHGTDWDVFLGKSVEKECPIAMRYLRTVLVRMKFELGMIAAILAGLPGMIWINNSILLVSDDSLFWFLAFAGGLLVFLFFEAQASSNLLARVRRIVCGLKPDIDRPTYKHKKWKWCFSGVVAWTVLLLLFIGSMWVGGRLEPITPGVVATAPSQYQTERLSPPEFNQRLELIVGGHPPGPYERKQPVAQ